MRRFGAGEQRQIAPLKSTIAQQAAQIADLQAGGAGVPGYIDIDLQQAANAVLFTPTPPAGGGWTLQGQVGQTLSGKLVLTANAVLRGTLPLVQGQITAAMLRWTKAGQADVLFTLYFLDSASTPAPRAFDMGPPRIVIEDVWQVGGTLPYVDVPIAWVKQDGVTPYPCSRNFYVICLNGTMIAGDWAQPQTNWSLFPHNEMRAMIRVPLLLPEKRGAFTFRLYGMEDSPQPNEGGGQYTNRDITIHIVNSEADFPSGYVKKVYKDAALPGPVWDPPSSSPYRTDDLSLLPLVNHPALTEDAWQVEFTTLNGGDFYHVRPGTDATRGGHVWTKEEIFPLVNGKRRLQWRKIDGDPIDGFLGPKTWAGAFIKKPIMPSFGWLTFAMDCPNIPGMDSAAWQYLFADARELDFVETLKQDRRFATTFHDIGGGNKWSFSAFGTPGHHRFYFRITQDRFTSWSSDPDGSNMRLEADCPNFFPDVTWPFFNFMAEGPGGASGPAIGGFPYENYSLGVDDYTEHRSNGAPIVTPLTLLPLPSNANGFVVGAVPAFEYRASYGTGPYDFSVNLSQTVAGVTGASAIDDPDGYFMPLSGTPTDTGTIAGTLTVTDAVGAVTQVAFSKAVAAAPILSWSDTLAGANDTTLEARGYLRRSGTAGALKLNGNGGLKSGAADAYYVNPARLTNRGDVYVEGKVGSGDSPLNLVIETQGGFIKLLRLPDGYTACFNEANSNVANTDANTVAGETVRLTYRTSTGMVNITTDTGKGTQSGPQALSIVPTGYAGFAAKIIDGGNANPMVVGTVRSGNP